MENTQVNTLCQIRDVYRAIYAFELKFQQSHDLQIEAA